MNAEWIFMGLGNPGREYAFTRHNAGFLLLDILAQDFGEKFSLQKNLSAEVLEITGFGGKKILLLKPQTYMNLSGESLQKLYQRHGHLRNVPIAVAHDEVDLPMGKLRIKMGGGDAGHNGLKSIRATLGHGDFYRLRLGVGRPSPESRMEVKDHVLTSFKKAEEAALMKMLEQGIQCLHSLLTRDLAAAQATASLES